MTLRAIIAEDEFPAQEELQYLIETYSSIEVTKCFDDGLDVLKYFQENTTDILFLDINLPSLDGMMLAGSLANFKQKPIIVFTTAYKEHAAKAFELEAFDYILKPYSEERVASMLQKLETKVQAPKPITPEPSQTTERLNVWKEEKIYVINVQDIAYAEADEKQTVVHTKDGIYTYPGSISTFEELLSAGIFFRCHRSYIVNTERIHEILPWFHNTYLVKMKGMDEQIPVSRSKAKQFRQIMRL
ncbi:two component transcriptional regulator, LytTR family [Terribacillus aidingensis]|uniref:Two component transcriptional regulator, LytTR family n=1 Tax=Terribacillus aidingensis TaxID=586416 RepID=A0A285MZU1_9BACI|nr:two component transcriptional regulator, LytTR family [Terribacillus aidingensis]